MRFSTTQYAAYKARNSTASKAAKAKRATTAKKMVSFALSAHAKALAKLFKDPSLGAGKQEHFAQVSLFNFFHDNHEDIYDLFYAIPNSGKRHIKVATEMKAEGQKSGYPDMGLDTARGIYHGFRCELKTEIGTAQPNQVEYAEKLREQGYCVVFCYGFDAAVTAILEYWNLSINGEMSKHVYKPEKNSKK